MRATERYMRKLGELRGMTYAPRGDASPWLHGRVFVITRTDGTLRTCRHLRPGETPHLLLWHPREAVCGACTVALHAAVHRRPEDARCDVCGVMTTGPGTAVGGIYPFVVEYGPLVVEGGACRSCRQVALPGEWPGDDL